MANSTPSRPGLKQGGADNLELFLDVRGGEVLASFDRKTIMRDLHLTQTLSGGKKFRFPAIWQAGTQYHTPGVEITGSQIPHSEIEITPDDKLISDVFLADVDEFLNDLDVRSPYSKALGEAIAVHFDRQVLRSIILSARGAALFTGDSGGTALTAAGFANDATTLFTGISQAKEEMDKKDVPVDEQPVNAVLLPTQWYLLARSDRNLNRDYNGGESDNRKFNLTTIDDVNVKKLNIASAVYGVNASADTDIPSKYRGNFATTIGTVFTPYAAASAIVQDLRFQAVDQPQKQGWLLIAGMMTGTGPLRTKTAVELKTA